MGIDHLTDVLNASIGGHKTLREWPAIIRPLTTAGKDKVASQGVGPRQQATCALSILSFYEKKHFKQSYELLSPSQVETESVQCPTCFEWFEVAMPPAEELPQEVDYDCEVCCRPMILVLSHDGAYARGLND